ncbi:histidine kinase [Aquibacillus sp. 3ASR75-11]|uniref:Histidine kinase n=1 Tax=Terrihalobacillus insolitus TaxID=2950438 RepID=A0A9X3WTU3_9BACI|nr:histidine kinase [Terrihalobacillus insolitus]MDC3412093.1 histidine kinase [Terrihalobacillus insolitus]MDC3423214.1 histidine kinase [Terrihalobacillus insolitus]
MDGFLFFSLLMFLSLFLPLIAFVLLIALNLIEKEFDYLQLENKRVHLEKQLHQMEYMQLSQQIKPHFLFNSLNAMTSLARLERNEDLIRAMERFSLFLRYQNKGKESLVLFETELEHTRNYLYIQSMRYGKKLEIQYNIDPKAENTLLPPYTLQTFVENAFKHGLDHKRGEKRLDIQLRRHGDWVILKVLDNGEPRLITSNSGTGLDNIRKRLQLVFEMYTEVTITRKEHVSEVKAIWPYTPKGVD